MSILNRIFASQSEAKDDPRNGLTRAQYEQYLDKLDRIRRAAATALQKEWDKIDRSTATDREKVLSRLKASVNSRDSAEKALLRAVHAAAAENGGYVYYDEHGAPTTLNDENRAARHTFIAQPA